MNVKILVLLRVLSKKNRWRRFADLSLTHVLRFYVAIVTTVLQQIFGVLVWCSTLCVVPDYRTETMN